MIFIHVEGSFDEKVITHLLIKKFGNIEGKIEFKTSNGKEALLSTAQLKFFYYSNKNEYAPIRIFLCDLHPYNIPKELDHQSVEELRNSIDGLLNITDNRQKQKRMRILRFFALKYNLEVLFIADIEKVFSYLKIPQDEQNKYLGRFNKKSPEETPYHNQNHEKEIINDIFSQVGEEYSIQNVIELSKLLDVKVLEEKLPSFREFLECIGELLSQQQQE